MEAILRTVLFARSIPGQALGYASAGLIGTTVHYAVLTALLQGNLIDVVAASTVGAVTGGLVNYWLNHAKVFKSRVRHQVALPRFAVVATFGIAVNAVMLAVCAPTFGTLGGQLISSVAVLVTGYSLNRIWSFRD